MSMIGVLCMFCPLLRGCAPALFMNPISLREIGFIPVSQVFPPGKLDSGLTKLRSKLSSYGRSTL